MHITDVTLLIRMCAFWKFYTSYTDGYQPEKLDPSKKYELSQTKAGAAGGPGG